MRPGADRDFFILMWIIAVFMMIGVFNATASG